MNGADTSIYKNFQPVDVIGAMEKGRSMKELAYQRDRARKDDLKQDQIDEAYKAGIVTNPDGTTSFDNKKTLSQLAGISGKAYLDASEKFTNQEAIAQKSRFEKLKNDNDFTLKILGSVNDEDTYQRGLKEAKSYGIDTSQLPQNYDPKYVGYLRDRAISIQDQINNQMKDREFERDTADKKEGRKIEWARVRNEGAKIKNSEERIPFDAKKEVETIASKNGNITSIKNEIDAFIQQWPDLSADQKLKQGQSLLKTLNSTQGSDAVGAEESKRLGSYLEFATGNFTNSNPTQFGRNLEGFFDQVSNVSNKLGTTYESNKQQIDKLMGRSSTQPSSNVKVINGQTYRKVEGGWLPAKK